MSSKHNDLKLAILDSLREKHAVTLQEIAQATGRSTQNAADRRAIQRALKKLIDDNLVLAQGKARAREYLLKEPTSLASESQTFFQDILLSEKSKQLLASILERKHLIKSIGYHQDFLKSYQPNKTWYLNSELRNELFLEGNAEPNHRPAGTYARHIFNRLLIDLSWNSSRLEGNTYSLLETKRLIELGEGAVGKNAAEAQMILNHKDAIEYIVELADEVKITSHEICSIHALLSENLLGDPSASGRLREIAVGISGTSYTPLENPHILKEHFNLFIDKINQIEDPFEQSFFSLVHLSYLQAFEDVNKRTARLTANIPLIKKNLRPLSFVDVSQKDYIFSLIGIYEKNDVSLLRDLYKWAYKRSSQRYSALQQNTDGPNLFKLKYRNEIHFIIHDIVLKKIVGNNIVFVINQFVEKLRLSEGESAQLLQLIETEIISLHDGNIARFKIRPSEFQAWKKAGAK